MPIILDVNKIDKIIIKKLRRAKTINIIGLVALGFILILVITLLLRGI